VNKEKEMILKENLWKVCYRLSLPAIIAMVLYGLNVIFDGVFVGRLVGKTAFAGISIVYPLTQLSLGLGSLVGVGAGSYLSILLGEDDRETQGKIVGRFKQEQAGKDEEISSPEEFWNGGDGNRRDRAIQQLKKIMNLSKIPENPDKSLSSPGTELIDVRTPQEFSENHIKGAKNITLDDGFIQNVIKDRSISKSTPIYLYCRSGNRSYQAARQLIDAGYINIYDLGGINDAKQLLNR